MELNDYLRVLRRRWVLILVTALMGLAVSALVTLATTPLYSSTARLFVSTSQGDTNTAYQGGLFSAERVASYSKLVSGRKLAGMVKEDLGLDEPPEELAAQTSATVSPDTVILEISVTDPDPDRAQAIAQSYAEQLPVLVKDLETPEGKNAAPIKATIVDDANLPTAPTSPQPPRNLSLGLLLGLLLGFSLAVLRELLDTSLKSPDDIEQVTEAPLLGTIPFDSDTASHPLISDLSPMAPRAEAFRVLRTNMQFLDVDRTSNVFVISSATPTEGKTTTSVNLAVALAQAGGRTLLIEADLRRPKAATVLRVDSAVGLTTVLLGKIGLGEAIQDATNGLHVLASGALPPNPAELLQSQAMARTLTQLRTQYDTIIIDAPPLLPVTDAALLAVHADGAVLVVRHGKTSSDQLHHAIERLEGVGASLLGVVLNMTPRGAKRYGYGYGYGYGYASDEKVDTVARDTPTVTGSPSGSRSDTGTHEGENRPSLLDNLFGGSESGGKRRA